MYSPTSMTTATSRPKKGVLGKLYTLLELAQRIVLFFARLRQRIRNCICK